MPPQGQVSPLGSGPALLLGISHLQVQRATGVANSRYILATARDPNGFQLGASQDVRGQINFLTKETGPCCPCSLGLGGLRGVCAPHSADVRCVVMVPSLPAHISIKC